MQERKIEDVVETLRKSQGCSLLIGSGCSVKAGIPVAKNFVPDIKREYPEAYKRAVKKNGRCDLFELYGAAFRRFPKETYKRLYR